TSLIGVNVVLVIYGLLVTRVTEPFLAHLPKPFDSEYIRLILDTLIATTVIILFAEFLPKAIFCSKAEQVLSFFALPMLLMYYILYPLAKVFVSISEFILKYLFRVRIKE